ncbi:hypothetical protein D3C73_1221810 [compost metagenome]
MQPVRAFEGFQKVANRIRELGYLLKPLCDACDPADIQCQTVQHRFRSAAQPSALQIFSIGGDDGRGFTD